MKNVNRSFILFFSFALLIILVFGLMACHSHEYSQKYEYDSTSHWRLCSCGEKADEGAHSFGDWIVKSQPSEEKEGVQQRECSVCGYVESETIEKIPHSHSFSTNYEFDQTNHWNQCRCGEKQNTAEHSFGEWITIEAPTDEKEGIKSRTCPVCGYVEKAKIEKLPHVHSYSSEWSSDSTNHWHACKCGDKSDLSAHSFGDWTVTKAATITEDGIKERVCSICQYRQTQRIEKELSSYNTNTEKMGKYSGINVTELPYTCNGITVLSVNAKNSNTIEFIVRNDSGKPTDDYCKINYKIFSLDGIIQNTSFGYLDALDPGESCYFDISVNYATNLIKLSDIIISFGKTFYTGTMSSTSGLEMNTLPYKSNGLVIESVHTQKSNTIEFIVRNDSGKATSDFCKIPYKIYSSDGIVQNTSFGYLDAMDPGECCYFDVTINSSTVMIKFGEIVFDAGNAFYSGTMSLTSGLEMNTLPYKSNGLVIESVHTKKSNTIEFIVRNDSGKATSDFCKIPYKIYSSDGIVQNTSFGYLDAMDPGECCYFDVTINSSTAMIKFGEIVFDAGNAFYTGTMSITNGISMNTLPYKSNGLTVVSVNVKTASTLELIVRNDSGKETSDFCKIPYKIYSSDGIIQNTSFGYLDSMEPGEACYFDITINSSTATIKLGEIVVDFK